LEKPPNCEEDKMVKTLLIASALALTTSAAFATEATYPTYPKPPTYPTYPPKCPDDVVYKGRSDNVSTKKEAGDPGTTSVTYTYDPYKKKCVADVDAHPSPYRTE
jgi:hypothetical protein